MRKPRENIQREIRVNKRVSLFPVQQLFWSFNSKVLGRNTKIRKYTNKAAQKNNTVPTAYSISAGVLTSEV